MTSVFVSMYVTVTLKKVLDCCFALFIVCVDFEGLFLILLQSLLVLYLPLDLNYPL